MIGATHIPAQARPYARAFDLDTVLERDGAILDLAAVERAVNGLPIVLNDAEQYEAARQLSHRGHPLTVIAKRTGINLRRVGRWSARGWPEAPGDYTRGLLRGSASPAP